MLGELGVLIILCAISATYSANTSSISEYLDQFGAYCGEGCKCKEVEFTETAMACEECEEGAGKKLYIPTSITEYGEERWIGCARFDCREVMYKYATRYQMQNINPSFVVDHNNTCYYMRIIYIYIYI